MFAGEDERELEVVELTTAFLRLAAQFVGYAAVFLLDGQVDEGVEIGDTSLERLPGGEQLAGSAELLQMALRAVRVVPEAWGRSLFLLLGQLRLAPREVKDDPSNRRRRNAAPLWIASLR